MWPFPKIKPSTRFIIPNYLQHDLTPFSEHFSEINPIANPKPQTLITPKHDSPLYRHAYCTNFTIRVMPFCVHIHTCLHVAVKAFPFPRRGENRWCCQRAHIKIRSTTFVHYSFRFFEQIESIMERRGMFHKLVLFSDFSY